MSLDIPSHYAPSTINRVEASTPILKKMRECNACKDAWVHQQLIGFEITEDNSITVKTIWKQKVEDGKEHKHKLKSENAKKQQTFQRR